MVRSRLLASTLLGFAAVCRAIHLGPSVGSAEDPEPFDPASDGLLVFSMGKTGSTTLQSTFGKMMKPPCELIAGDHSWNFAGDHGVSIHRAIKCHAHKCAMEYIRTRPAGSRTWVIASNRNPYSRAPSAMFQEISTWTDEQIRDTSMSDLFGFFHDGTGLEKYHIHGLPNASSPQLRWYTNQFKEPLGLDIFAHRFDFDKKVMRVQHVFDNRTLEVLFLRLEDSTQWETILKPFFPDVKLTVDNVASEKKGALDSKYKEFLSALQYTEKEIDTLSQYESLNFFYTRDEKEAFILKARVSSSGRLSDIDANDLVLEDRLLEDGLPVSPHGLPWC